MLDLTRFQSLQILEVFSDVIVIAGHPQDRAAVFEGEYHPRVPSRSKFEVVALQAANPKATVQVWLAKRLPQLLQGLGYLILTLGRQTAGLHPETGRELNP